MQNFMGQKVDILDLTIYRYDKIIKIIMIILLCLLKVVTCIKLAGGGGRGRSLINEA
jgi:hypothetical protein